MTHTSSRVRICYFYNKSSWFTMNIIVIYVLINLIIFIRTKTTCYRNNERKANIPNTKKQLSKRGNSSQMDPSLNDSRIKVWATKSSSDFGAFCEYIEYEKWQHCLILFSGFVATALSPCADLVRRSDWKHLLMWLFLMVSGNLSDSCSY